MKKILLIGLLLVIMLGIAGVVGWRFLLKSNPIESPYFVDKDALTYAVIPDGRASYIRYKASSLPKLWEEKSLAQDMRLIVGMLAEGKNNFLFNAEAVTEGETKTSKGVKTESETASATYDRLVADKIGKLVGAFEGESFIAIGKVTSELSESVVAQFKNPDQKKITEIYEKINLIAGMKGHDGGIKVDEMISSFEETLTKDFSITKGTGAHAGVEYRWAQFEIGIKFYVAPVGSWRFFSISEEAIKNVIDHAQNKSANETLAGNAKYLEYQQRLGGPADGLIFGDYSGLGETIINAFLASVPEKETIEKSLAQAKEIYNAMGISVGTVSIGSEGLVTHYLMQFDKSKISNLGATYSACDFRSLSFTQRNTMVYGAYNYDLLNQLKSTWQIPISAKKDETMYSMMQSQVKTMGLDLEKNILGAIGPEVAIIVNKAQKGEVPLALLYFQLQKPDDFKPTWDFMKKTSTQMGSNLELNMTAISNAEAISIKLPMMKNFEPVLVVGKEWIVLGTSRAELTKTMALPASEHWNVNRFGSFQTGEKLSQAMEVDLSSLLEVGYGFAQPVLLKQFETRKDFGLLLQILEEEKRGWMGEAGVLKCAVTYREKEVEFRMVSSRGGELPAMTASLGMFVALMPKAKPNVVLPAPGSRISNQAQETFNAKNVKADLLELRIAIKSYVSAENPLTGKKLTWEEIQNFLIPDSNLELRGGLDQFGRLYELGEVGGAEASLAPETMEHFAEEETAEYWK